MSGFERIKPEDIDVGVYIWYGGQMSVSGWDCPGIIYEVNEEEQWFRIQSLDDLNKNEQKYEFVPDDRSATSSLTIRKISVEEAFDYVRKIKDAKHSRIGDVEETLRKAKQDALNFQVFFDNMKKEIKNVESV
ncbi:hypothetical protein EVB94_022 [Rhizobium phage RHph_TM40]|uniref:Uncharacterized protein n=1 Tax=Rhizobium phage RHph_TM30 TaxID=2509764 RepID=A0A7S5RFG9_9CAUD|nr:hypothetical protein PQC16_gp022 [Rhizobium phage RHph_TM30]QIG71493.1 hypothetical protein EVB94_022 [Rhizobium phage RHph_TM40]QIG72218.1 hypothetical protein EVB96_022 [Rhizobium phage RHph_TM3_3_6]QIG77351.1 hypothetical protein EVB61_023 [Rhizobium phage RHph_TM21B]QIG77609.1 hypothetical protein EVB64_022 [Rhizobium phage RHph_TM61]QIG71129.1 hypothetical protein EVB93_022 [Rhizobium phage RHph_TM30]